MREKLLARVWVAGSALIAFGASLGGTFQFDDLALFSDPGITSSMGWRDCFRLTQTRPLTWFTFWLNYQVAGENAWVWHLVNLALHVAVAVTLLDVLGRLIPGRAALIGALIFAVHPILAEPVNYVFARGTLLATLFGLLTVRSWIGDRRWAAVGWFAAAMLAKEEVAALPLFLGLLDWSRRGVGGGPGDPPQVWRPAPLGLGLGQGQGLGLGTGLGALFAMGGIAVGLGLRVVYATAVIPGAWAGVQAGISPLGYFAVQGVAVWRYLRMLVWPWGFTVDVEMARPAWWVATLAWVGIAGLCGIAARWFRSLGVGFWVLGGLVLLAPSATILPASDLAADRRLYLPMIALCAAFALLVERVDGRVWAAGLVVLVGISVRTSLVWRTPEALWGEAKLRSPDKIRPRLQLARALPPDAALRELSEAQKMAPGDPAIAGEMGRVLLSIGKPAEALAAFGRALALDPEDAGALNNRGTALAALGQTGAARADFLRALKRDPCLFDARVNLKRWGGTEDVGGACRFTPGQLAEMGR